MHTASTAGVDLVAIDLPAPQAVDAIRRSWDRGEAVVVLDRTLPPVAAAAVLDRVRPTALVDTTGRRSIVGTPVAPGTAAVVLTSGTSAEPKAAILTRGGMQAMAHAYSAAIEASDADRWLVSLPLHGVAGLAIVARSYVTGVPVVVPPEPGVDAVSEAAVGAAASIVSLVPTALRRLLEAGAALDRFRVILVGGAPLPDDLRAASDRAGAPIVTTYGMTETWGGFALDGRPIAGAEVRVDATGAIEVRGAMVMAGYRFDPESTAAVLVDGWLATGDTGSWDGHTLAITGRAGDRIISGGVTISPSAVERVVRRDPRVADVAVVGAADPEWGERVVACVVLADAGDAPSLEDLRALVKGHMAPANAPRELRIVEQIPRNEAGKILRRALGGC